VQHPVAALEVLWLCLLPYTALGWDFRVADMEGLADVTLTYGLLARVQGRNKDLIAIANGEKAPSAPSNAIVIATLFVCALSIAGAIFLILLDQPFEGVVQLPSAPLRNALAHLGE